MPLGIFRSGALGARAVNAKALVFSVKGEDLLFLDQANVNRIEARDDEQYRRQGFERVTERTEGTMAEAVRLLTREALTREPPPPAAKKVVDLWRPWLQDKIAKDLGELDRAIQDQDAYARATRRLIQDLDLDLGDYLRRTVFNFEKHRRIEHYGRITSQTGIIRPPE